MRASASEFLQESDGADMRLSLPSGQSSDTSELALVGQLQHPPGPARMSPFGAFPTPTDPGRTYCFLFLIPTARLITSILATPNLFDYEP